MMKLKLISAALLLSMTLSALSCSGTNVQQDSGSVGTADASVIDEQPIDAPTLAKMISDGCSFSEELGLNNAYLENHMYGFMTLGDIFTSYTAYIPAGITPEEVFVFETKTEADTAALVDKLKAYVGYLAGEYSDYAAEQVPKLENPVIAVKGCLVVYVVSEDNAAAAAFVSELLS